MNRHCRELWQSSIVSSLRRSMALSSPVRMMISPNSCGVARRPLVSICQESWAVSGMGASPSGKFFHRFLFSALLLNDILIHKKSGQRRFRLMGNIGNRILQKFLCLPLGFPEMCIRDSFGAVALIPAVRIKEYGHGARIRLIFLLLQRRNAHRGFVLCQTDKPAGIAGFGIFIKRERNKSITI